MSNIIPLRGKALSTAPGEVPAASRRDIPTGLGDVREPALVERLVLVLLSILGLCLLSPLILVIALAIKATSRGPIFYRGERVGRYQKPFRIFKFRTLETGAEEKIGARLLNKEDHYYTPIGKFLKRTKLDEIPQLLNVVKGEMSLVGPRPIRPVFLEPLTREIPNYAIRFWLPPGMTGLAQIRGGYFTDPRDKLRYELFYLTHRSFLMDVKLIGLTMLKLLNQWITLGFFLVFLFLFVSFVPEEVRSDMYMSIMRVRFNLLHIVVIILGSWLVVKKIPSHRLYLYRNRLILPMLVFVIAGAVSALFSEARMDALRGIAYFAVTGFFLTLLIINSRITRSFVRAGSRIVALSSVALSVLGLLRLVVAGDMPDGAAAVDAHGGFIAGVGIASTLGSPMALATYLILGIPFLMTELTHSRTTEERDFWVACATISFVGILLTKSFMGLFGLLLTMIVYLRHSIQHQLFNLFASLVFFVIIVSIGVNFKLNSRGVDDVAKLGSSLMMLVEKVQVDKLLIGVGARSLSEVVPDLAGKDSKASPRRDDPSMLGYLLENGHVRLILENGLVGWTVMLWILWNALITIRKAYWAESDLYLKSILWAAFVAILGFLVSLNGFNAFSSLSLQFFFWSLIGVAVAITIHHTGKSDGFRIVWRFGRE